MITARPQKNLVHAKAYFREHLGHGDYYSQNQKVQGDWFGQGAVRLGLEPGTHVTEEAFIRLCDNQHPGTGEQLTVRQRKVDRRVFHDFVVAPPKSVSIVALVGGDERILETHAASSRVALARMERYVATRVRREGQVKDRFTREMVAAEFQHDASRSLDPHLHTHFVVFNATFDSEENRWKAVETRHMFDALHFLTEVYRNEMRHRLLALGYSLRSTAQGFEIAGVSDELIQRFSKGRRAILTESERLEHESQQAVSNNQRAVIAHEIRARKLRNVSAAEVRAFQRGQLSHEEMEALKRLRNGHSPDRRAPEAVATVTKADIEEQAASKLRIAIPNVKGPETPKETSATSRSGEAASLVLPSEAAREAIDFARDHLFERKSVVSRPDLLAEALKHGGERVTLEGVEAELGRRTEFLVEGDALTTKAGLEMERRIIVLVNSGVGRCRPLRPGHRSRNVLTDEQHQALTSLLESPDRVLALRGAAGTGKTEVLREFIEALTGHHELVVLASIKSAVKGLEAAGVSSPQTVQRFLQHLEAPYLRPVVVVDEAGLLSNAQMQALIQWVDARQGRLLLSGDSRQHASVEAGDALRILERHSAIQRVPLRRIQRQTHQEYRAAIADLAEGRGEMAVSRLERLGAIVVLEGNARFERAAEEYVGSVQAGKTALAVCPTWREVDRLNGEIRSQLQSAGLVARKETMVSAHRSLKWTRAQKRDFTLYEPGHMLNFHRSTKEFQAGASAEVIRAEKDRLVVRRGRYRKAVVTRKVLECFDVAEAIPIPLAHNDCLLIQGNRKAAHLLNGQVVTVDRVERTGAVRLTNGRTIPPDFRLFTYGHAMTSQTSQGRTVDHVYVVMNQYSQAANAKALYVSASRGRERLRVFCDSDDTAWQAAARPGNRLSATEMLEAARERQTEVVTRRASLNIRP
jgi:conjugative relaxase-like TrwC/TraI family protein